MTAKATAVVLFVTLGATAAIAVTGAPADPPIGAPVTVYRTVVETSTVSRRIEGRDVHWWRARAVRNRRLVNTRGITLQRIRRSLRDRVRLGASGLEQAFLCIHQFEGSWEDTGSPYWGGVQMDYTFMSQYGAPFLRAYGPANNWTPAMQLVTAERAYLEGRGFGPWPNTSRMCGLR